jgi:hypothetical protein
VWLVLLSLLILFITGRALLFLLNNGRAKDDLSYTELALYSFSLGYAGLTIITLILAQIGILVAPMNSIAILSIPTTAIIFWVYRERKKKAIQNNTFESQINLKQEFLEELEHLISRINLSTIVLIIIFVVALFLRLETQLTTPWLGDQDPYYHLSFIDSIVAQGTLPSRTFWGFYSYPPSFHLVFATLISTIQVDRYLLMKIVPEFLGFLAIPAVYALIKRKYGEWPGIASAAFLAICSVHIYRTNIAIPDPIALLGIIMFFHAITTQEGTRKYLLAGLFASMVFLTNVIGVLYFLPSVVAIFLASLILRRWNETLGFLKATFVGLLVSGIFWLPALYTLGLSGIFEGLGPAYPYYGVFSFTSNTYFSWIGVGACILAIVGLYVCIRDFKNSLILLIPLTFFLFLIEVGNNGYHFFEPTVLVRGLLFLGTWVSLLAGVGFWQILQTKRKRIAMTGLAVMIVLTMVSFPVFSRDRYPVNWDYEDVDFAYRSYLENYADIFKDKKYMIYSADWALNYGAFNNVILAKELPQMGEAIIRNESSAVIDLINERDIKYLIFNNGTQEVEFLVQSNLAYIYYENWHTIVLAVR